MRDYMHWYKIFFNRNDGDGLKITKFHQLLNFVHYAFLNGSMCNINCNWLEAICKTLVKDLRAITKQQVSKLTYQAAYNFCESRNIDALAAQLQHLHPHLFEKYKMKKCFLNSTTNVNGKFDQGPTSDETNGDTHAHLIEEPVLHVGIADTTIISKVIRFLLTYVWVVMRFRWSSINKYRSTWHDNILTYVQNLVFGIQNDNVDMIKLNGFTELHVKE